MSNSPDKDDASWTYVDCYDRFYRYKDTEKPVEYRGEHKQIKEGGWLIQTWSDKLKVWYWFENMDDEKSTKVLISMLIRNANVRKKITT